MTADRLNSVTQIAYKIDGTHGVALTTDLLKLQAYALYRTIGQAPSVRIYFLGQQFRPACSSRACRRCGVRPTDTENADTLGQRTSKLRARPATFEITWRVKHHEHIGIAESMPQHGLEVLRRWNAVRVEEYVEKSNRQSVKQLQSSFSGFTSAVAHKNPPLPGE
ncbi:MAG: hypothetical protein ABT02_17235 [Comamonadaceae bacterium SCN 68-20]|nr:MAG: hypothetical protein ABT02_17235 [Comamonadaceae bacterium SCN 68-20]